MDKLDRRSFLRSTAVLGGSLFAIEGLVALGAREAQAAVAPKGRGGYGPLLPTRSVNTNENLLELPEGFQYTVFSKGGTIMTDGRPTPGGHDGMAAFAVGSMLHLVRNHELSGGTYDMSRPYDPAAIGGTTTLVLDPGTRLLVEDYLSQSGTLRNCAGGITPWGSWITCEETTQNANNTFQQ